MTNRFAHEREILDDRPAIGWRLMAVYSYRNPGERQDRTMLTSLTRPNLVWSVDGPCEVLDKGLDGFQWRELQAVCRPERYSGDHGGRWVTDKRVKKGEHAVPKVNCKCGYAAYHTYGDLVSDMIDVGPSHIFRSNAPPIGRGEAAPNPISYLRYPATILALTWGFGEVVGFDNNYRAEFMSLAALCNLGEVLGPIAESHAKAMGIPAMSLDEMVQYAPVAGRTLMPEGGG